MRDGSELTADSASLLQKAIEVNPLLQFLGLGRQGRRVLPLNSQIKRVVFSPDGGMLLQSLAGASRTRVYASLAFLECAAVGMPVGDIISFLKNATDNQILEKVLESVEGPGTLVSPGLKAAMKNSESLSAHAIGILNRLLGKGCNLEGALDAASPKRHFLVRGMLGFAETHNVHALAKLVAHLCTSQRQILALDALFLRLEQRAPAALPQERALLKVASFSELSELLKNRIMRYRGAIPVPPVSHPRLQWINSVPRLNAIGKSFRNCLNGSIAYTAPLLLGRTFIAIYTRETTLGSITSSSQYVLHVTQFWDDEAVAFSILDAKGVGNEEICDNDLADALQDLSAKTGHIWRLNYKSVFEELLIHDFLYDFVD
jgi:hypothetical protein